MTATVRLAEPSEASHPSGSAAGEHGAPRPGRPKGRPGSGAALYRRWWTPLIWISPAVLVTAIFGVFPFLNTIVLSFTNARPLGGGGQWVGLENYERLLGDEDFWLAVSNSVIYAVIAVPLLVLLPLIVAQLVYKHIPFIGFFRTAFYTPVIASMVAVALVWQNLLNERGPINTFLSQIGLIHEPIPFLSDSTLLLLSAIALTVWKGIGWYMIFYLAALANVPQHLYEAAELDGAGPIRRFVSITIPSVKLTVLLVAIMSGTGSLRIFTEIFVLGGSTGGPGGANRTLPFYIRDVALDPATGNTGYGSAVSIALFVMTIGLAVAAHKLSTSKGDDE